jgi:hypothetical protein
VSYPRLSTAERRKLASSARAKAAGRNAALRVGVMGGAGPDSPPNPDLPYYELPAADREVLEAAIDQTRSADPSIAGRAKNALRQGFEAVKPDTILGAIMRLSPIVSGALFLRAFFAGLQVRGEFDFSEGAVIFEGSHDPLHYGNNLGRILLTSAKYDSATGVATLKGTGYAAPAGCSPSLTTPGNNNWGWTTGRMGLSSFSGGEYAFISGTELVAGLTTSLDLPCEEIPQWLVDQRLLGPDWNPATDATMRHLEATAQLNTGLTGLRVCGYDVHNSVNSGWSCQTLEPEGIEAPSYGVGSQEYDDSGAEGDEKPDVTFNKEETQRLIECLKDPACSGDWDRPDPCEPTPPGDGYDPPGWNPPDPGGPPGGSFDPGGPPGGSFDPGGGGYDPGEGPEFGGYGDPGPGDGYGTFDPGRETCITFRDPPAGFNDPTQPGGIARRYQPGQRTTVRSGGTPREADAVERADTSTTCWDALVAAGWRTRANDGVERLYPPYDFIKRKDASDVLWNCLILLGWTTREADEDVEVVTERALYRPGAPDVYTGKIKRVKRLENGGVRICFNSPLEDKPAPEKICFRGKVIDAISSVLSQMGVEDVIFDSDCTEVIFPRVCFPAGTPLRHILNYLLDLCGFCVFPQFDGKVIVGHCEPLNVHWHYHEDVDLIGFDLEYDNTEIPAIVEVFRPDKINRAGRVTEAGYAYPYPVQSPFGAGDDVLRIEVPYGTTNAHVRAIAHSKARGLGRKAMPLTSFAVPLNSRIKLRHQIHIRRPSLGFTGVYMITRLAREYADESYLNLGMGRWLRGDGE